MSKLKKLIENGKNFTILKFKNHELLSYEIAFDVLIQIDKIINDNFLSLSNRDFDDFKENGEIDLVLGTQGYSARFFKDEKVLRMVFIEGDLE